MSSSGGIVYSVPPPQGIIPNSQAPYHATGLIVVICVFLPLAVVAVSIRTFTRSHIVGSFAVDDCKFDIPIVSCRILTKCLWVDVMIFALVISKHPLDRGA